jgi:20S proteasome subunit alpha 6
MYDTDVTTWSPQGRVHQIEYAKEAVKQGSAVVGLVSKDFALLGAVRRAASELAEHQQKLFRIDDHMGIGISGLVGDARVLCQFMREEALNHKYVYGTPIDTQRLVTQISDQAQIYTQTSERRPYGVGLLVIGYDEVTGPRLFETCPSAVHYQYFAQAIGARSQSAKTYLERNYETFPDTGLDDLILHVLRALKAASPNNKLSPQGTSVAFVGKDSKFTRLTGDSLQKYLSQIPDDERIVEDVPEPAPEPIDEDVPPEIAEDDSAPRELL